MVCHLEGKAMDVIEQARVQGLPGVLWMTAQQYPSLAEQIAADFLTMKALRNDDWRWRDRAALDEGVLALGRLKQVCTRMGLSQLQQTFDQLQAMVLLGIMVLDREQGRA
jgi:hypothetical protein